MSKEEIIKKAIQKAIDNGFNKNDMGQEIKSVEDVYYYFDDDQGNLAVNNLIWRHDFAKALWGDNPQRLLDQYEPLDESGQVSLTAWEYHLQNMVIADDPIAYLGDNL